MSLAPPGCGPPPSSASSVFIRMTPTCRMDGSCGVQNPRTPQRDVGKDFRWVSVDPALSLSLLYSLAWICLAIDSGKGIPHNTNLGTRCSWNLSFGEVTSFLTQGPLCPILPYFVSRFPSCINQAKGLLSCGASWDQWVL